MVFTKFLGLFLVLGVAFMTSCTRPADKVAEEKGEGQLKVSSEPITQAVVANVPEKWQPLAYRLAMDNVSGPDIDKFFARLGDTPTQDPMGRKIKELYTKNFVRKPPPDPSAPKLPRPALYKNVVTEENAAKCRDFIQQNEDAFLTAEIRYGVPKEIAAALLFVETRLGSNLGAERAAFTLASMAQSRTPQSIDQWFGQLPGYEEHLDWMADIMPRRADWAYKELRALLLFSRAQELDPLAMPGSIYGAVGLCQFMPSNLVPYGADGNGDGIVDLFAVPDAIASLSNYLVKNGWKPGQDRAMRHKILKRYNNANIYANTIIALADLISGNPLPLPVAASSKAMPAQKKFASKKKFATQKNAAPQKRSAKNSKKMAFK